ncbi:MAG: TraR/DksA family transcriptional regulator [Anaerolineae bacterium]
MPIPYEELRQRLEARRARMLEEIDHIDLRTKNSLGYTNHQADDATYAEEQATNMALKQNVERLLEQVDDALQRLDEGTYGICVRCGAEIDPARLKALPYAPLCLDCQRRQDLNL